MGSDRSGDAVYSHPWAVIGQVMRYTCPMDAAAMGAAGSELNRSVSEVFYEGGMRGA
jgi:hypothetical protein